MINVEGGYFIRQLKCREHLREKQHLPFQSASDIGCLRSQTHKSKVQNQEIHGCPRYIAINDRHCHFVPPPIRIQNAYRLTEPYTELTRVSSPTARSSSNTRLPATSRTSFFTVGISDAPIPSHPYNSEPVVLPWVLHQRSGDAFSLHCFVHFFGLVRRNYLRRIQQTIAIYSFIHLLLFFLRIFTSKLKHANPVLA